MERFNRTRKNKRRLTLVFFLFTIVCGACGHAVAQPPKWETRFREKLVAVAESQLHVRELTGNNDGPDIKKYLKITGLGEGYPWCAAFTSWVFVQAGGTAPRSARVVDWFKTNVVYNRDWRKPTIQPQKAMVIGLYYPHLGRLGHIGIVTGFDGKNIYTIEGNTNAAGSREGQGVYRKIRPLKTVAAMADYSVLGRQFDQRYYQQIKEGK